MSRRINCQACHDKCRPMHSEDVAMGFHQRIVAIEAKKPEKHGLKIYGDGALEKEIELPTLECDSCGQPILDGTRCYAVTMWRGDDEIGLWEHEFGKVLP